jgi:hypothetical protein
MNSRLPLLFDKSWAEFLVFSVEPVEAGGTRTRIPRCTSLALSSCACCGCYFKLAMGQLFHMRMISLVAFVCISPWKKKKSAF